MMNIFIMILMAVLMMGYYLISSPSTTVPGTDTQSAVEYADLRSIAECAMAVHNGQIRGYTFDDICVEQSDIHSQFLCLNNNMTITECGGTGRRKPAYSYIITTTGAIDNSNYNNMMEILERYYSDAGTFGIFQDGKIVSGGTSSKRSVHKNIISKLELTDGQLIYLTQYETPDTDTEYVADVAPDVICPAGTAKTYRFGRWQCVGYNTKINCGGDMIWDSEIQECVPDESRKPLCASNQSAVIVDDVWECINPFPDKECPNGMTARLNYGNLEWECVANPGAAPDVKKCAHVTGSVIYGRPGTALRVLPVSCTDCEVLVTDDQTCTSICVPDASKVNDAACYPGRISECEGPSRAIYFGFPNNAYATNVPEIREISVPLDKHHAQNRKFNCLDCGDGVIDQDKSFPPFVAVCK